MLERATRVGGPVPQDRQGSISKECITWKEIRELWKNVGEASGESESKEKMAARMYKGRKGFFLGRGQGEIWRARKPRNTSVKEILADRRFTVSFWVFLGLGR